MSVLDKMKQQAPEMWAECAPEIAQRVAFSKSGQYLPLQRIQSDTDRFNELMCQRWHGAFNAYQVALNYCRHEGVSLYNQEKDEAHRNSDFKFRAVSTLHANSCVAAHAVLLLLQAGLAQEALNKWRSMFEFSCFAVLLRKGDQELAERYILHAHVEDAKMLELEEAELQQNEKSYNKSTYDSCYERRDELIEKYGKSYNTPYGWAVDATQNKSPQIKDIVRAAGFYQYMSEHKAASMSLHGSFDAIYNISTPPSLHMKLWGPSSYGIAQAAEQSLLMLLLSTVDFLNLRSSRDVFVAMEVIEALIVRAQDMFASIEKQIMQLGELNSFGEKHPSPPSGEGPDSKAELD